MSCGVPPPNGNEEYARQIQAEEEQIASNENLARKLAREGEFDPNFNTNGDAALAQRLSYANSNEDYENILSEHDYVRSAVLETKLYHQSMVRKDLYLQYLQVCFNKSIKTKDMGSTCET